MAPYAKGLVGAPAAATHAQVSAQTTDTAHEMPMAKVEPSAN
jgi:hypothetical protein